MKVKKQYQTKTEMAKDIAAKFGIGLSDAKSRLSRSTKPEIEYVGIVRNGERCSIKFYITPEKYLK